jgi:hypothetical protein
MSMTCTFREIQGNLLQQVFVLLHIIIDFK